MSDMVLSGARVTCLDVFLVVTRPTRIGASPQVMEKIATARAALDRAAARGEKIYGLNTGLGGNIGSEVEGDTAAFQRQLVEGRSAGVGGKLPEADVRAILFARAAMLAQAGSGVSPHVFEALLALMNARIHPVMPGVGSIGAGDLVLLAPIARALYGDGDVEVEGQRMPAAEALAAAGLSPVALGPKDGLSLINASAASAGLGACAVAEALALLDHQTQAAALTMQAIGANRAILDPRINAARPAAGQEDMAARLRTLLGDAGDTEAKLQDPLSVRCAPSILGALATAVDQARATVELELNAAGDNPLVLADDDSVLSTGNFHTPALALAFETLGLAIAQAASASAARFIQLTGSGRNGLPRYLSAQGGASAGFVPLQKPLAALVAAIRHKANPVMLDFLVVSEGVEDHAPQTLLAVAKCREMIDLWRRIVAFELVAGAQAADLSGRVPQAGDLRALYDEVRAITPSLDHDRALGADVEALAQRLEKLWTAHDVIATR